ncbi:MAG: LutB/LldF family L-lactate oxidation iron-sulfur protein [bacterium]
MQPTTAQLKVHIRNALLDQSLQQAVRKATDHSLTKRAEVVAELANWEELRVQAARIRDYTLTNLGWLLLEFEERASAKGIRIHWAEDADTANRIIAEICAAAIEGERPPLVIKSKSMTTEEIGLTAFLEHQDCEVVETDLGEYIVQLAGQIPSHITAPALHLSRRDIGRIFADKLGVDYVEDPVELINIARRVLREKFIKADVGITGVNFAIAETGTPLMVENEGNGRLVGAIPKVQISLMGIEKVVPTWDDFAVLLELLPRSATGQRITGSVVCFNRPSLPEEVDGPREYHVIILDNGRSSALADDKLRTILRCIRCGACLNACPVYRRVGGHAYGWVYPGPIGAVLAPIFLGLEKAGDHPFASSLCGRCTEICPVGIELHNLLLELRARIVATLPQLSAERAFWASWKGIMDSPELYRALATIPRFLLQDLLHGNWSPALPIWGRERSGPDIAKRSFAKLFRAEFGIKKEP